MEAHYEIQLKVNRAMKGVNYFLYCSEFRVSESNSLHFD